MEQDTSTLSVINSGVLILFSAGVSFVATHYWNKPPGR